MNMFKCSLKQGESFQGLRFVKASLQINENAMTFFETVFLQIDQRVDFLFRFRGSFLNF